MRVCKYIRRYVHYIVLEHQTKTTKLVAGNLYLLLAYFILFITMSFLQQTKISSVPIATTR